MCREIPQGYAGSQAAQILQSARPLVLNDQCAKAGIFLGIDPKDLNTLSDYAVRVRYPGDDPTPDEAREALSIAKAVRRVARKFLDTT